MRGKPAGNGAFARNFPNDDVVSRVKNRLAVFEVTGAASVKTNRYFS